MLTRYEEYRWGGDAGLKLDVTKAPLPKKTPALESVKPEKTAISYSAISYSATCSLEWEKLEENWTGRFYETLYTLEASIPPTYIVSKKELDEGNIKTWEKPAYYLDEIQRIYKEAAQNKTMYKFTDFFGLTSFNCTPRNEITNPKS